MHFEFHQEDTIPPLAWCAQYRTESGTIIVYHGQSVELFTNGFVEGAWDGDYASHDFSRATVFCGTGGAIEKTVARFFSGSDRNTPIFSIHKNNTLFVSNSPVFVMAQAGETPDAIYPFYSFDILAIWRQGLYCSSGELRTNSSARLSVHFETILSVDVSGNTHLESYPLCATPTDYASYRSILLESVKSVFMNGNDSSRNNVFQPIATISKGYDSCASAALSSLAGCKESISFSNSSDSDPISDTGVENAHAIGLTCTIYDRWQFLKSDSVSDAEFSLFTTSAMTPLLAAEDQLRNRILVAGYLGDVIWDKKHAAYCTHHTHPWARWISGLGYLEFRLRVGFIVLSPPCVASRHNLLIHQITNASEMRSWSIGGNYDRPIPRRIAEEAGMPRKQFGMKKMANAYTGYVAPRYFSKTSLTDYRAFIKEQHVKIPFYQYRFWKNLAQLRYMMWRVLRRIGIGEGRIMKSTPLQRRFPFTLNCFPTPLRWEFMFLYQWSFARLKNRYSIKTDNEDR